MNKDDLKGLSRTRLREAKILFINGEYSGAYYLAGYCVECALKACIAKKTQRYDFPNKVTANASWSHSPTDLVRVAGIQSSLDAERKFDKQFDANWGVVKDWGPDSRYGNLNQKQAEGLIEAISNRRHGVLKWLRRHW